MPQRAFIAIGTNLGDRLANYQQALERISALAGTRIVRQSSIYETEPVGEFDRPFLNGAVEIETEFDAQSLLRRLMAIERALGRRRSQERTRARRGRDRSRVIDLDLLLFNREIIDTPALKVPHPRMHERRFVLMPLSELAPAFIHPVLGVSISELLASLKSPHRVTLRRADSLRPQTRRREVAC
jgi:2-amino-4-hydroxy-6-hydroxymethyldihydropteridine diphosphokinase